MYVSRVYLNGVGSILKYRNKVTDYIRQNGIYTLKKEYDGEHFESIGCLNVTEEIYDQIINMWNYFEGLLFLHPTDKLSWHKFESSYSRILPLSYGVGYVKHKYATSVFTKGHVGDHLIFVYGSDYDETLVAQVIEMIHNF